MLHLQRRKKSGRGYDGLEWLLWQFYWSADDIFTEDGAESFPRRTLCFRFNPDHFFGLFTRLYFTAVRPLQLDSRQRLGSIFHSNGKILHEPTAIKPHWSTLNAKCRGSFHKASYSLDVFFWKNSSHTWWPCEKDPTDLRDISYLQHSRVSKCRTDFQVCTLVWRWFDKLPTGIYPPHPNRPIWLDS